MRPLSIQRVGRILIAFAVFGGCGGARAKHEPRAAPVQMVLPSVDGGEVDVASYRGRVVVLHVFATWAATAHGDVDQLSKLFRERSREVEIIGIALDQERRFIRPWRTAVNAPYVVVLATEDVRLGHSPLGEIREVPATFVLDRTGRIVARIARPLLPDELDPIVRKLLVDDR